MTGQRFARALHLRSNTPAIVPCAGEVGLQRQRPVITAERLGTPPQLDQRVATIVPRLEKIRIAFDRRFVICHRLGFSVQGPKRIAAVIEDHCALRHQGQGAIKTGQCLSGAAHAVEQCAMIIQHFSEIGLDHQRALERSKGFVWAPRRLQQSSLQY